MKILQPYTFKFQAQELPQKLCQVSQEALTGYLLFEFPILGGTDSMNRWCLGVSQGQVVFSGNQKLSWQVFLKIFQRYISRLQNADVRYALVELEKRFMQEKQKGQSVLFLELMHELQQLGLFTMEELRGALRLGILSDFDTYLFKYPGQAKFIPSTPLELQTSLSGFDIEDLLSQAKERQVWWKKLRTTIPSMESVPLINSEVVNSANLTNQQKLWLKTLVSKGQTLNDIASSLAQDSLEIAKVFASLIDKRFIKIQSPPVTSTPEIFVVDDSPLILKQFETLVTTWGYSVRAFNDPTTLLQSIPHSNPAVFFLDINMPGITGFDLVKQIRRQPQLASVPIIMLTAEQTLTNNWRARWSGCQFLSKPLAPNDVSRFKQGLRLLLSQLLLIHQSS
ncbi:response regulator [Allocoleopsis franciscana]|nr:response regulator [Allocoleopsis franciscana]